MSQDRSSVEGVVKSYFDGLYEGDAEKLGTCFILPPTCAGSRRASCRF
jgi:hypothetical protein